MIKAMDLLRLYNRVGFCAEDAQIVDRVEIEDDDYYEDEPEEKRGFFASLFRRR